VRISRLLPAVLAAALLPALSLGTILFQRRWHLSSADAGRSVALDADTGYAVGAGTRFGGTDCGAAMILVDSLGDTVAVRSIAGLDTGAGFLCRVNDGGHVIVGSHDSLLVFAQKFDATGDSVWTYSAATRGLVFDAIGTADGGCLIAGRIPDSLAHFGLVKLHADGSQAWIHYYADYRVDWSAARGVAQTKDGGFILCGDAHDYNGTYARFLRTDSAGQQSWNELYVGPVDPSLRDICETSDGGFLSVGWEYDTLQSHNAVYIVRIDTGGAILRTHNLSPGGVGTQAMAMDKTGDGGYIVAATIDWGDSSRVWLIRLDANSDTTWTTVLPGTGKERAADVRQTADGGYVIAGTSDSAGGSVLLIRTNPQGQLPIIEKSPTVPDRVALSIIPNPARGVVRIETSVPMEAAASLKLYDATGKLVRTLTGAARRVLPVANMATGTYFLRLESTEGMATQKLLVE